MSCHSYLDVSNRDIDSWAISHVTILTGAAEKPTFIIIIPNIRLGLSVLYNLSTLHLRSYIAPGQIGRIFAGIMQRNHPPTDPPTHSSPQCWIQT